VRDISPLLPLDCPVFWKKMLGVRVCKCAKNAFSFKTHRAASSQASSAKSSALILYRQQRKADASIRLRIARLQLLWRPTRAMRDNEMRRARSVARKTTHVSLEDEPTAHTSAKRLMLSRKADLAFPYRGKRVAWAAWAHDRDARKQKADRDHIRGSTG
jgi:hypothetical protein